VERNSRHSNQQTTPETLATRAIIGTIVKIVTLRSMRAVAIRRNREFIPATWAFFRTNPTSVAETALDE
jgi:predicted metal-dependent TIM-barrel fold hydrolase